MQAYGSTPGGGQQRGGCPVEVPERQPWDASDVGAGAHGVAPAVPLGIHGRFASPPASAVSEDSLVARYARQVVARVLLPERRSLQGCSRWLRACGESVQLLHVPAVRAGVFGGLQHCGSVWQCPVCAAKISERRRRELSEGLACWREKHVGAVSLVTYTVRHRLADDLRVTLDGLLGARRRCLNGAPLQRFNARYGVVGRIRALEVTYGEHGWHPHIHELVFTDGVPDEVAMLAQLRERWSRAVVSAKLRDVNDHGVDLRLGDLSAADYVAKFGRDRTWHVENEVTKAASKRGRFGRLSPTGLLDAAMWGDGVAGALWREYAEVFQGRKQLAWSSGLRELLGLGEERTDEEIVQQQREDAVLMDELARDEWACVLGQDARAELLRVLGGGSISALRCFLAVLGVSRFAGYVVAPSSSSASSSCACS